MEKEKAREEIRSFAVDIKTGLTTKEVEKRVELGLTNKTPKGSTKTIKRIIFTNIFTFFNLLNAGIATLLIYVGAYKDIFFLVIITLNTLIGIIQEIKAKQIIDKLSLLSAPSVQVLRDSEIFEIAVGNVVLNDILILKNGKQITADAIVREGYIEVDESLLTGESNLIVKTVGDKLYSGSFVSSGYCLAEAVKVGKESYIEDLTKLAKQYKKPKSDLMRSLKIIVRTVAVFIIPISLLLFNMQYEKLAGNMPLTESIRATAGAIIGMIPSGLILLTSVALAVGVLRLAQNNTLVQELYCIEMLARIDTLCLDKTGTITDGTMEVKSIIEISKDSKIAAKEIIPQMMAIFTDRNQTSEAMIDKFGVATSHFEVVDTIPFSSQRKYSAVSFKDLGTFILGAPETVLVKNEYNKIENTIENYAKEGLRILIYAHSKEEIKNKKLPAGIRTHALILIEDKIRPDAILTIEYFKTHNVDVKVISGDNPITVAHIAKRAGIENADRYISLEGFDDSEVFAAATKYQVFGRVTPHQKKILIKSLKTYGKTVAMVGDGVNDILALREADTSIAMASGSEAARNASHLVLLDSDFSSMPKVVNEGRRVINNIQKVAVLFLTKTIFSIFLTLIVLMANKSYPITPSQLFMIDFLVIGIPAFILSLQPNHDIVRGKFLPNVLKRAMPGALAIVLQIGIVMLYFANRMSLTLREQSTIIVITATFTALIVLYRSLKPFNTLRRVLFIIMFSTSFLAVVLLPEFFEFSALFPVYISTTGSVIDRLPFDNVLLLILLLQSSSFIIDFFAKFPGWIKRGASHALKKLSGI